MGKGLLTGQLDLSKLDPKVRTLSGLCAADPLPCWTLVVCSRLH